MAAKPLPQPRSRFHVERIREVWDKMDPEGAGALSYASLKRILDDLEIDWSTCGLVTAKINRAVFEAVETTPDVTLTFDDFWAFAVDIGKPAGGVDPVLETHAYMGRHRVAPLFEAMTAALMVSKPEDPRGFLAERLAALKASGTPVLEFTDDELATLFDMSDVTGGGAITGAKAGKALEVLTGRVPVEVANAPERVITREEFVGVAKGQLGEYCS